MKLLILNGPNLNLLGRREPELYGKGTYAELCETVRRHCSALDIECEIAQSNHEGVLIDLIQQAGVDADGIVINPAGYTHTSVALLDALLAVGLPAVEVHITDPDRRESFRSISYIRAACIKTVKGRGFAGYTEAIDVLKDYLNARKDP